jgi:hypothetical protein
VGTKLLIGLEYNSSSNNLRLGYSGVYSFKYPSNPAMQIKSADIKEVIKVINNTI